MVDIFYFVRGNIILRAENNWGSKVDGNIKTGWKDSTGFGGDPDVSKRAVAPTKSYRRKEWMNNPLARI